MNDLIHVCPLVAVNNQITSTGATHLVTLINNVAMISTPDGIKPGNHLRLTMNDISQPQDGLLPPEQKHVEELLGFIGDWDQQTPMLFHCLAGISRSTAAAFITLCALNSTAPENHIAQILRNASPTAHPNRRIVQLGDTLLRREGKMIAAIENMPPRIDAAEGIPFSMPAKIPIR